MADNENAEGKEKQGLTDLLRKIPGFKGYFARDDRREADKLLRERLVLSLQDVQAEFAIIQKDIIAASGFTYMEKAQSSDQKLQSFIDRIQTAPRGYSSLFSLEQIDEEALDKLTSFDNALFGYVDKLAGHLSSLKEGIGTEAVGQILRDFEAMIGDANDTFKRREESVLESE